jgi:hypothetical protein
MPVQPQDLRSFSVLVLEVRMFLQHSRTHGKDHFLSQGCKLLKQIGAIHYACDMKA